MVKDSQIVSIIVGASNGLASLPCRSGAQMDNEMSDYLRRTLYSLGAEALFVFSGLESTLSAHYMLPRTYNRIKKSVSEASVLIEKISELVHNSNPTRTALTDFGFLSFVKIRLAEKESTVLFLSNKEEQKFYLHEISLNKSHQPTINCLAENILGCIDLWYSAFKNWPPEIAKSYWAHSINQTFTTREEHLEMPWRSKKNAKPAATLSLDLRRSSLCMEQAQNSEEYAIWLNQMVKMLIKVAQRHGGIFDKFTGDGVLIHFLARECRQLYDVNETVAAINCAFDMQYVMAKHMAQLRTLLRLDNKYIGPAIGIDVGDTNWQFDLPYPVVTGVSVSGACRLCDPAPATEIWVNSAVKRAWEEAPKKERPFDIHFQQKDFISKEFPEGSGMLAWSITMASKFALPNLDKLDQIVEGQHSQKGFD